METSRCLATLSLAVVLLVGPVAAQTTANGMIDGPDQLSNTAFSADRAPVVDNTGGWREGRATFYDAPDYFQQVRLRIVKTFLSFLFLILDHEPFLSFLSFLIKSFWLSHPCFAL